MTVSDSHLPIFLKPHDIAPRAGCTLVIGNFDGVHLGHKALLAAARAQNPSAPIVVLSFEPHPREFFAAAQGLPMPAFRLTLAAAKARLLRAAGADDVALMSFDASLAALSAADFIEQVIVRGFGAARVVIGEDFVFGQGRGGNVDILRADGRFAVTAVTATGDADGAFSSTRVRNAVAAGDFSTAARVLGRPFVIEGPVVHGDKRGRTLGYPTANQTVARLALPPFGIYAVRARLAGEEAWRPAVANLGIRPMFEVAQPILETFIFDFVQDIYDRHLYVEPVRFLRPEARFDGLDALISQMKQDCQAAQAVFKSGSL